MLSAPVIYLPADGNASSYCRINSDTIAIIVSQVGAP